MEEEQRCERSNAPLLCANNCGFYGNPATLKLCSKCYRHHLLKEQRRPGSASPDAKTTSSAALSSATDGGIATEKAVGAITASCRPSRCGACRKRVGLTGFKCRCGAIFCGAHRYPEMHSCAFDFKAVGKEAIAKANPLIKAAKLENML